MSYSEKQRQYNDKYDAENMIAYTVKYQRSIYDAVEKAMEKFHANHGTGKPTAVLMTTAKGKGVSYMENQAGWHGKAPNDDEYAQAMAELAAARSAIEEG